MQLLSINVSLPEPVQYRDKVIETGIYKKPVSGPVTVHNLNIDGDRQADLEFHGGIHQAVYVYSAENYDFWRSELEGVELEFGHFGENLTVTGMLDSQIMIGDRFCVGTARFEVTQPRAPCYKLAMKMQRTDFVLRFREAGRPGFYCKVLEEGEICTGDAIQHEKVTGNALTIRDAYMLRYFDSSNYSRIRECAALPALAPRWRNSMEKLLLRESK